MSEAGKNSAAKGLIATATDKFESAKIVADQQAIFERRQRENNVFAACRSRIINEPALWFRAPDYEGSRIGDAYLMLLQRKMDEMLRATMTERGVTVPDGTVKFGAT